MAKRFRRSTAAINSEADAVCARLNGGYLDLYDGAQPSTADAALTDQRRLARLAFGVPAFRAADGGIALANELEDDYAAAEDGTATWFRACSAAGIPIFDGTVGTENADCVLANVGIRKGARVRVDVAAYEAERG